MLDASLQFVNWRMASQGQVGFVQLIIILIVLGLILTGLWFLDAWTDRKKR